MSSCKFWKERSGSKGINTESGYNTKQRRMAPLLRLDSTGEISSAKVANSSENPKCYKTQQTLSNSGNQLSLKSLFDNLKMSTVIDSANAYIGSAASYLEGFCNSSSRKNLVRSDSDTTALQYLHNMWKNQGPEKDHSGSIDSVLPQGTPCKSFLDCDNIVTCPANSMQSTTKPATATVPSSIFGVFQNSISNCNTMKSKSEPYIPPPLKNRHRAGACSDRGAMFDPKLTPYNARLLARSRNQRSYSEGENQKRCHKESPPADYRRSRKCFRSSENDSSRSESPVDAVNANVKDVVQVQRIIESSNCDNVAGSNTSGSDTEPTDIIDDWFDYENNNVEASPVPSDPTNRLETLVSTSQSSAMSCENVSSGDSPPLSPPLLSWRSVEFDVDVQKAAEASSLSSQEEKSQISCDIMQVQQVPQSSGKKCSESHKIDNGNKTEEEVKLSDTETESACVFPSILYVRNIQNKKCRPSSKKRRRQKGQPTEVHINESIDKKNSSAKKQTNSVAFILGIDPENGNNASHPFLISCDTDSGSDWSDSDLEVDGVDGDCMEELCSFNSPFGLFNLEVVCSLQPTSPPPCSTLDAINLSWQVNMAMESEEKPNSKKSHFKKVHFVDDKDLATVHHMVAWSHAYAAARKGPWEEIARDRGRFLRRITDGEKLLKPILDSKHRETVFQERFNIDTA